MEKYSVFPKTGILSVGSIILLGFLLYLNTLGNGFVFDDHPMIEERTIITEPNLSSVKEVLFNNYRPLRDVALMLISSIGGPYPVSFHLASVLIHLLNGIIVYHIASQITRSIRIASLSALLFITHPIQTDAVAYISGLRDVLFTMFVLIGLYIYMIYRDKGGRFRFLLVFSMLGIGLATKEMAVGLVLLILLYDLKCVSEDQASVGVKTVSNSVAAILRRSGFMYLSMGVFILSALVFYLMFHQASARVQGSKILWWGDSIALNYLTVPKVWLGYLIKLIFPYPLMADYMEYPIVPVHVAEASAWFSLFILIAIFYLTSRWLVYRPLVGFALGWVLLTLIPVVQIVPHHELIAEHHLYLPSVGFCLLVAVGIDRLMHQKGIQWGIGWIAAIAIVAIYSFQTINRNMEWKNDLTLFQANLRDFPDAPRSYMQLGNFYQTHNMFRSAREAYERALSIKQDFVAAHNNLGVLYYQWGQPGRSINEYKKALNGPLGAYVPAYTNLGRAFLILGRTEEGIQALQEGLSLRPKNHKAVAGLFYAYRDSEDENRAEAYLQQWLRIRSNDPNALRELASQKERYLDFAGAVSIYDRLIEIMPSNEGLYRQRSMLMKIQQEMGRIKERMKSHQGNSEDFLRLAEHYQILGATEKAQEILMDAWVKYPKDPQVFRAYLELIIKQKRYNKNDLERIIQRGKHFQNNPQVNLLTAQILVFHQRIKEAYQIVKYTLSELPAGQPLRSVIIPSSNVSICDQSRILATVFERAGFVEAAFEVLEIQRCSRHELESVHLDRARLSLKLNKINMVIDELQKALKMNPVSPQAHTALGFIMLNNVGDFESAAIHFTKSLRLEPQQRGSEQMRAMLAMLEESIYSVQVKRTPMDPMQVRVKIDQLTAEYNASIR